MRAASITLVGSCAMKLCSRNTASGSENIVCDSQICASVPLMCGDGRIVITAAEKYGARGVGFDLDPQRIKESNENAQKARVTDRVRFVQGDLFETNLSEATVVTLYLLPEVNKKLRPKLLAELKPGSRVVSHNYDLGDEWQPDEFAEVTVSGTAHYVYLWTVPAQTQNRPR